MNVATFTGRRLDWRGLLALVLVPLLVAGAFLAGTWRFDANLRRVQAAIVNNDEMVELNGQQVPLGRQLSAALVDTDRDQNFTWVLADEARARAGLAAGRYAAVVTIPKNFSAAATSFGGSVDEARQATITIETSPVAGIAETAVGQSVADAAAQSLNNFITELYLDNVYIGFGKQKEGMVTVADGARQLADGNLELSDGIGKAADGAGQLADGLGQAADGARQLADNGPQLSSGARQLADGLGLMADQTRDLPAQIATMSAGADQLAAGLNQYADGVEQYVTGINSLVDPVLEIVRQLPDLSATFDTIDGVMADLPATATELDAQVDAAASVIREQLARAAELQAETDELADSYADALAAVDQVASGATTVPCPERLQAIEGACAAFAEGVREGGAAAQRTLTGVDLTDVETARAAFAERTDEIEEALTKLTDATEWFATNAAAIQQQWNAVRAQIPADVSPNEYLESQLTLLRDGGTQLVDGGRQLASGTTQLAGGIRQLSDGLPALVDGIGQLASGSDQLADGVGRYVDGVAQLSDGIGQAHDGTVELASGLTTAHDGSVRLADGMDQLATGLADGAKQIPSYTETQRQNLAKVVASPISTTGLDELVTPAAAAVSLLLVVALWLGALATYALIRPVDPRNAASSSTTRHLVVRALLPGFGVAAVQAAILAALGSAFLGLSAGKGAALFGALLLAGLAFAAVNHALAAWGGVWGRLVSGVFLLVTSVTALTYTAPGVFDTLRGLSPLSPALDAVRAILTWQTPALMLVTLAGWLAIGAVAGAVRILRSRTVSVRQLALAE
nr:hypothetical protein [Propionibacterium sp.]